MLHDALSLFSGSLIGLVLGLIGGGGSILAVPLLVYVVGVPSMHVAIGTSAVAVAGSALASLAHHARAGHVRWPCAIVFSATGMLGAIVGSTAGKRFDGQKLLFLFGLLMIIVAASMAFRRAGKESEFTPLTAESATRIGPRLALYGVGTGMLSGFFGIGGGFLIVPGLVAATDMPLLLAVGSSLVSVSTFGVTTAASYAVSGLIDWRLVAIFVAGGVIGSYAGGRLAGLLSTRKQHLSKVFAAIVGGVGLYVVVRSVLAIAAASQ